MTLYFHGFAIESDWLQGLVLSLEDSSTIAISHGTSGPRVSQDPDLGSLGQSQAMRPSSTRLGSPRVNTADTELELNTASKTAGCQFEDRGYRTEVTSSSDLDYDFGDDQTWQAGTGEELQEV